MVLRIKQLVFDEGLTLSGARRRLDEDGGSQGDATTVRVEDILGDRVRDRLKNVRSGLQAILQMLSDDRRTVADLELVPPQAPRKKGAKKK